MQVQFQKLEDKIFYYEGILKNPYKIINLINLTDRNLTNNDVFEKWELWKSSNDDYIFGERKFSNPEKYETTSEHVKLLYDTLKNALSVAGSHYAEFLRIPLGVQAPISISKYYAGNGMGPHTDSGPIAHLSAVMYLNDDYDGGELGFPNHNITIKPSAGSVIVFPSVEPYVHDPKNVTRGEKYISPSFWFKNWETDSNLLDQ
jgi:predicted 2-oxoglutarate/Fe(II)-dependent dioxygenase YbiX